MKEYDENEAVDFINRRLEPKKYPADEILNVIDMIWDYYESNGMLEIDDEDDEEEAELPQLLAEYVGNMLRRDELANVDPQDIPTIVNAELDYEKSLETDL